MKRPDKDNLQKLDDLIKALEGETLEYPEKLTCCGFYLSLYDEYAAFKLAGLKLKSVKDNGLDGLVTTCPMCFKMLDAKQEAMEKVLKESIAVPVFYYPQLLGLAMGIEYEKLGLHLNLSPVKEVLKRLQS
ncbi:MAG: heterodisulfide reductase-related iron-sulfur binding cluster [Candidatus Bathyarchaeia archaeon]